jgi:hypothetical protein
MRLTLSWGVVPSLILFAGACSSGGSSGGGSGGAGATGGGNTGGYSGQATGGSAGQATGGSAGQATGGSAGQSSGGSAGQASGGSAGQSSGGSAGSAGQASGGTGGTSTCSPPISGTCDDFPQCGCSAGKNCDVTDLAGTTSCVNAGGIAAYGHCTDIGQCGAGYSCVGQVCKPFCTTSNDCPGVNDGAQCIQVTYDDNGTTKPIPGMYTCTAACDPLQTNSCGGGAGCFLAGGTADCVPAGLGVGVGACASDPFACAPGYVCLSDDSCRKWCRVGLNDCTSGQSCVQLSGPVTYKGYTWGTCQ